jgi:hypothetical protein
MEATMAERKRQAIPELERQELVDTGVDTDARDEDPEVDHLSRAEVEEDPGEATRKLPKNDQAL